MFFLYVFFFFVVELATFFTFSSLCTTFYVPTPRSSCEIWNVIHLLSVVVERIDTLPCLVNLGQYLNILPGKLFRSS